ncbi:class I SAM-dependent methyltransferase [Ktedonospora formicarum]|uniref:Methyltransferase type 11 domain-containing protein n=1 Tax=Ktedonospora formicarum TaxID=2778364 RepID=A0A8J3I657_9CHLR|nr:class I SAM-dependent methyltransferase [Ktedonospora formicarum]GHO49356.1 hypothetical protein KSX_75190 [Ktedonospora formicarum]
MSDMINQNYLLNDQYKDASNFSLRLHALRRMGAMQRSWYRWIFDHIELASDGAVLELGCGPGFLWLENIERVPSTWRVTLSDFSSGMLQDARTNLGEKAQDFTFEVIDAQAIPYPDAYFDVIIANAMLYHVPDLARALAEVSRVLKPGGRFYATSIGDTAVLSLSQLMHQIIPDSWLSSSLGFSIENGKEQIARWFSRVELDRVEKHMTVGDRETLMELARSGLSKEDQQDPAKLLPVEEAIDQLLARQGKIHFNMDFGLFSAR